jgi:hypothetical protein
MDSRLISPRAHGEIPIRRFEMTTKPDSKWIDLLRAAVGLPRANEDAAGCCGKPAEADACCGSMATRAEVVPANAAPASHDSDDARASGCCGRG